MGPRAPATCRRHRGPGQTRAAAWASLASPPRDTAWPEVARQAGAAGPGFGPSIPPREQAGGLGQGVQEQLPRSPVQARSVPLWLTPTGLSPALLTVPLCRAVIPTAMAGGSSRRRGEGPAGSHPRGHTAAVDDDALSRSAPHSGAGGLAGSRSPDTRLTWRLDLSEAEARC